MSFVRTVWRLYGAHRRMFMILMVGATVYETVKIANPYILGAAIDALGGSSGMAVGRVLALATAFAGENMVDRVLALSAAFAVVNLALSALVTFLNRGIIAFLFAIEYATRITCSRHAHALSLNYHEQTQASALVMRIDRGEQRLVEFTADACWQGLPTVIQLVVTFAAMAVTDLDIAFLYAAFVPLFILTALRQHRLEQPLRVERHEDYERASGHFGETLWNIMTVQSFANERVRHDQFRSIYDRIVALGRRQFLIGTRYGFVKDGIVNLGRIAVLVLAAVKASAGEVSVGDVVLLLALSEKAFINCFNLTRLLERSADAREAVRRLTEFLDEQPTVCDAPDAARVTLRGDVALDRVSFAYPPHNGGPPKQVLRDVSLTIAHGETIALAGPSGGGKSTIAKLLFRHYDATEGAVLLDGHDVRRLAHEHFLLQLGYVTQEGQMFSGTVAENIRFGKHEATNDEVREAARLAGADAFITQLEHGYETTIGEQGVKLSGGQRQRVCIARAIIRKPAILVFDEATSSLDVESERVIQESLERLRGTTTIIVIAHRLSTIRHADRILVVKDGRIAEEGTHAQLLRQNGLYHRLVQLQAEHAGA